jgi:hypothetical protein
MKGLESVLCISLVTMVHQTAPTLMGGLLLATAILTEVLTPAARLMEARLLRKMKVFHRTLERFDHELGRHVYLLMRKVKD